MKAISVQNPWAHLIWAGEKTIEVRSWNTSYRGDLLICSSAAPKVPGMISGYALCLVSLDDVALFTQQDLDAACMDEMPDDNAYAWHLSNVRMVKPVPVKGKLNFYNVNDECIEVIDESKMTEQEINKFWEDNIYPLVYKFNQPGYYFKDSGEDVIIRTRVGQTALEYLRKDEKIWHLTDENSKYEKAFYDDTGADCLIYITDSEAARILRGWGLKAPFEI